jgi:hypothetical protein
MLYGLLPSRIIVEGTELNTNVDRRKGQAKVSLGLHGKTLIVDIGFDVLDRLLL